MTSSAWDRERGVASEAVRRASRVAVAVQAELAVESMQKQDRSPVTVADYAAQAVICRELLHAYPDDPIIGEEDASPLRAGEHRAFLPRVHAVVSAEVGGTPEDVVAWIDRGGARDYRPRFWTLDPIDGTKGFLRQQQYAIALALIIDGQVTVAALGCPGLPFDTDASTTGTLFTAVRGRGTSVQPLFQEAEARRARVSTVDALPRLRMCESVESAHSQHDQSAELVRHLGIEADPVRLDSQAKYGLVARGDAEVYLRLPTRKDYREMIWDHAAGALIVQEAGGAVTDIDGRPLDFTRGRTLAENRGVLVSHGPIHDRVLAALQELRI